MASIRARVVCLCMGALLAAPVAAVAQNEGAAEVSLSRGIRAFMESDYGSARRHFEAALALEPEFAAAHYFLGLTLLQRASATAGGAQRALLERAVGAFEQARLRDPQMVLAYLDAGIAQTILARFEEAQSGFAAFIEQRPDDPLPYLFLAVAHYRQAREDPSHLPDTVENLDKAEEAMRRSGKVDRSLTAHIHFYRGLVHLLDKNQAAAREAFQEGYEVAPDSKIGEQSKAILDKLVERRPWELTLGLGFDYDTNVTLRGRHVRRRRGEDGGNDWRFGLSSAFTYRLVDTDSFLLGVGGSTFNSWHTEVDDFDVQNYGTNVYAAYTPPGADFLTFSARYDWDFSLVGNQSFLGRHRFTPQVDIRQSDTADMTLFYQFDARNYYNQPTDRRLDRDGSIHVFGVVQRFELARWYERPLTLALSYRFEAVDTEGREFSNDSHIFAVDVGVPLPWDLTLDVLNEFEVGYYRSASLFDRDRSQRRDFIHTVAVGLTKQFNEHLSARFQINITTDDSNVRDRLGQEYFSYDRVTYGLNLQYRF